MSKNGSAGDRRSARHILLGAEPRVPGVAALVALVAVHAVAFG